MRLDKHKNRKIQSHRRLMKELNPKAQKVFQNAKKASQLRKEIAEMRDELDNRYGERAIVE